MNKKKEKRKNKNNLRKKLESYYWIIGLSLIVTGITSIFNNPTKILISVVTIYFLNRTELISGAKTK